ncbi:MAG: glycosyltransferase family 2 protein [Lachnospiraceae bacterium]|nr:glycosyltransferase family 2 protein [Lachnospiraceae bacterium]
MAKETLVVIPAYNEEMNIETVIVNLRNAGIEEYADVLVINDGSADNTEEVVKKTGTKVLSQVYNMGYGAALQTAYKYAQEREYKYIIQIDADGQHDVKNVDVIYEKMKASEQTDRPLDIIIGSRYLEGAKSFPMSGIRLFAVKMFRKIIKIVTKQTVTDPTSGLQGLSRRAFCYYAGYQKFDIRYPDINMLIQMMLLGYQVEETPAIMYERTMGEAMHSGIIKPMKYMCVMMLSTLIAILRHKRIKG